MRPRPGSRRGSRHQLQDPGFRRGNQADRPRGSGRRARPDRRRLCAAQPLLPRRGRPPRLHRRSVRAHVRNLALSHHRQPPHPTLIGSSLFLSPVSYSHLVFPLLLSFLFSLFFFSFFSFFLFFFFFFFFL